MTLDKKMVNLDLNRSLIEKSCNRLYYVSEFFTTLYERTRRTSDLWWYTCSVSIGQPTSYYGVPALGLVCPAVGRAAVSTLSPVESSRWVVGWLVDRCLCLFLGNLTRVPFME